MIKPIISGAELLADVRARPADREELSVWWLGQSGFLVGYRGHHLLLDPYLSDSLTRKYAETDKPHVRMTEIVIAPEQLDFIEVVTSSHNHTDHLDADTLNPLRDVNRDLSIVVPRANLAFAAERLNVPVERLTPIDISEPVDLQPFRLHAVPAAHEALDTDENGFHRYIGLVVQCGPWTVYHSGDCIRYDGQVEIVKRWDVDLAILPINGADPARRVAGNMNGFEAASLAKEISARCVIPCHYEMFEFNTASPRSFIETCEQLDQHFTVLRCGERWTENKEQ